MLLFAESLNFLIPMDTDLRNQPPRAWWRRALFWGFAWQIAIPPWSWFKPTEATEAQLLRLYVIGLIIDLLVVALVLFGIIAPNWR
jgi:hypothetical protein